MIVALNTRMIGGWSRALAQGIERSTVGVGLTAVRKRLPLMTLLLVYLSAGVLAAVLTAFPFSNTLF